MKAASSAAASLCRVWIGARPCLFGTSMFDTLIASNKNSTIPNKPPRHCNHYDRTLIGLKEERTEDNTIQQLVSIDDDDIGIPFGRARGCPELGSTPCPTTLHDYNTTPQMSTTNDAVNLKQKKPFVGLAVVGLVLDPMKEKLLITRRPSYMRSFPGAWVFPGGSVDPGESLETAMSRELLEETGLSIPQEKWQIHCVWESVYPTIPAKGVPIQAHHCVVYLSAALDSNQELNLCQEEVDAAAWMSQQNIQQIVNHISLEKTVDNLVNPKDWISLCTSLAGETEISIKELLGVYPRHDNGATFGMAQGSLFALEEFALLPADRLTP